MRASGLRKRLALIDQTLQREHVLEAEVAAGLAIEVESLDGEALAVVGYPERGNMQVQRAGNRKAAVLVLGEAGKSLATDLYDQLAGARCGAFADTVLSRRRTPARRKPRS